MTLKPSPTVGLGDLFQAPAHRVLADHTGHAQQRRVHRVAAQRRDVGVAPLAGQDGQHRRADHIAFLRRVRTGVGQRTVGYQRVEAPAQLQVFGKERQVAERRDRRIAIPVHMERAGIRIDNHSRVGNRPLNAG